VTPLALPPESPDDEDDKPRMLLCIKRD
jgi:hypothetical protein